MPNKGGRSRAALLDVAETKMLAHGIAGVSLRDIAKAGALTKGGLSHHFADKDLLARALIERAVKEDIELLGVLAERASRRSGDPLRRLAIFLRSLEDCLILLHPEGSLRAALAYQNMALSPKTNAVLSAGFKRITRLYAGLFSGVLQNVRPRASGNAMAFAELLAAIVEGAALLARAQNDPKLAARPIAAFRKQLPTIFRPLPVLDPSTAPKE